MAHKRNEETDRYKAMLAFAKVTPGLRLARVQSGKVVLRGGRWMQLAEAGTADLLGSWNGRALAVEAKVLKGAQLQTQIAWASEWRRAGGLYLVARDVAELRDGLRLADREGAA